MFCEQCNSAGHLRADMTVKTTADGRDIFTCVQCAPLPAPASSVPQQAGFEYGVEFSSRNGVSVWGEIAGVRVEYRRSSADVRKALEDAGIVSPKLGAGVR